MTKDGGRPMAYSYVVVASVHQNHM